MNASTRTARRTWLTAAARIDFLALNNPLLTTVGDYLRHLGATPDEVRRYASTVGRRAAKAIREAGEQPGRVLKLINHRYRTSFRKPQAGYRPAQLPLLATVVAEYERTAHLVNA